MSLAGIITGKTTKNVKNGDTMAFFVLDDGVSEIEVVVFAKYYAMYSSLINDENGVLIEGNISVDEGEGAKILLSSLKPLYGNADFQYHKKSPKLYVKVSSIADCKLETLQKIALLNSGSAEIVVFDSNTQKYCAIKDYKIELSERVVSRLKAIFGEENIVVK